MLRLFVFLLISFMSQACITMVDIGGQEVYDDIPRLSKRTYYLDKKAPKWVAKSLKRSVDFWNNALGEEMLFIERQASSRKSIHIKFIKTDKILPHPGEADLSGCVKGMSFITGPCQITMRIPNKFDASINQTSVLNVLKPGPLDELMTEDEDYEDGYVYLRDKFALLILTHEIGHTIGLGHSKNSQCIMGSHPDGNANICAKEKRAAFYQFAKKAPKEPLQISDH